MQFPSCAETAAEIVRAVDPQRLSPEAHKLRRAAERPLLLFHRPSHLLARERAAADEPRPRHRHQHCRRRSALPAEKNGRTDLLRRPLRLLPGKPLPTISDEQI